MERRVKERLIGASILVVLIVLVVPEMLSGPKPGAVLFPATAPEITRHVIVDLATSKPPANAETESVPAAAASVAVPASGSVSTVTAAEPTVAAAEARSAPIESRSSSPISTPSTPKADGVRGGWAVQLGSFASRVNADNLVRQLKEQGFSVYVLSGGSGQALRLRVRVGPVADRESAERSAAKLKALGHPSSLVAPGA
jgi:DedD protein